MSIAAIAGLSACTAAAIAIAVFAIATALRATALARRARRLNAHPVLPTLQRLANESARFQTIFAGKSFLVERFRQIGADVAAIAAAGALMDLNVNRIAFATELLLRTFVPTLRGSMAGD
jgi:hypothetical protein